MVKISNNAHISYANLIINGLNLSGLVSGPLCKCERV